MCSCFDLSEQYKKQVKFSEINQQFQEYFRDYDSGSAKKSAARQGLQRISFSFNVENWCMENNKNIGYLWHHANDFLYSDDTCWRI